MPKLVNPERAIENALGDFFRKERFRIRKAIHPHYYVYSRIGHQPVKVGFDFHWRNESLVCQGLHSRNRYDSAHGAETEIEQNYAHRLSVWFGTETFSVNLFALSNNHKLEGYFTNQEELEATLGAMRPALQECFRAFLQETTLTP